MEFLKAARNYRFGSQRNTRDNDFFSDRLSHRHTTKILVVFLVLATFKRFFAQPISCWVPAELRRYEKFINRYCWQEGTYYVDQIYEVNTLSIESRNEHLLYYYQWVYFFLLVQAGLFYFPRMIWHFITNKILDYDLFNIVDAAIKHETYSYDKNRILKYLSSNITNHQVDSTNSFIKDIINESVEMKKLVKMKEEKKYSFSKGTFSLQMLSRRANKSILTFSYIGIKALYLFVAILQIYLMNLFLSNKSNNFYGYEILQTILRGEADFVHQSDSKIFPRITICDVKTKELGADHTYTVQCVLSFNLFNERIYAFLWFWIFMIVIPFTLIDLIAWMKRIFIFGDRQRYMFVKNHVRIFNKVETEREKFLLKVFTELYLGMDGVFLFRLLEHNSNSLVVSDLFSYMWTQFKQDCDQ